MKNYFTSSLIDDFDFRVEKMLKTYALDDLSGAKLGVAVSGGADSLSLLTSLSHICKKNNAILSVITVDHRIRSDEESGGDAKFVVEYCKNLCKDDFFVDCSVVTLPNGLVFEEAKKRGGGIEEAARFLRYKAFDSFILEKNISFLCLAHNQNDQLETILMRFFQGSSGKSATGIQITRKKYIRPLIEISRSEIEQYLSFQKISWRTDATNEDLNYLRNRIRHSLVPKLNDIFPSWQKSLLLGAEKTAADAFALDNLAADVVSDFSDKNCVQINLKKVENLSDAILYRFIYSSLNNLECKTRIPFSFVKKCAELIKNHKKSEQKICISNIQAGVRGSLFFIEKQRNTATYRSFFDIIKEPGSYDFSFGKLLVDDFGKISFWGNDEKILVLENVNLPFCVRSRQLGDKILTSDGNMKNVNDVFSSWAVPENLRDDIPLIQELTSHEQNILCICGSVLGFNDWIVKSN